MIQLTEKQRELYEFLKKRSLELDAPVPLKEIGSEGSEARNRAKSMAKRGILKLTKKGYGIPVGVKVVLWNL